jgi:heme-degrading monooxygenase HmoA
MANVIVINPFDIPKGKEEQALAMWDKFATYFRRQPGYISAQLHRAINPDARFHLVTVAEWKSEEHFLTALQNLKLQAIQKESKDDFPNYPGLYEVIRTQNKIVLKSRTRGGYYTRRNGIKLQKINFFKT